jgi:hypothetical protein
MNERTHEIQIAASAATVWSILEDVRRMPELSPSTVEVDAPPRLRQVGDTFEQVIQLAGRSFRSTWEVTSIDPGRCLAIAGRLLPGTRYEMVEEVTPIVEGHCVLRLTMRWKLPFGPLGRLAGKLGAERRALEEAEAVLHGVRRLAEEIAPADVLVQP